MSEATSSAGQGDRPNDGSAGPRVTVLADPEGMSACGAAAIAMAIERARAERGVAHVALSGGSTPVRAYELLAARLADGAEEVRQALEVWFADERCVGPHDEQSNYKLVRDTLAVPAGLADSQLHRMEGELGPEEGARRYAELLADRLGTGAGAESGADGGLGAPPTKPQVLDLALLGMGPDGHIASLFPHSPTLQAAEDLLCLPVHDSPKPPPERITLSLGVLRASRRCLLLVSGAEKAHALAASLGAPTAEAPASLLPPARLHVVADAGAGSQLGFTLGAAGR